MFQLGIILFILVPVFLGKFHSVHLKLAHSGDLNFYESSFYKPFGFERIFEFYLVKSSLLVAYLLFNNPVSL